MTTVDVQAVAGRIAQTALDPEPAPNFYIEEVFPPNLYREMLARLPSDDALDFIAHPDALTADGRITRKLMDFTEPTLERLAPEHRGFCAA